MNRIMMMLQTHPHPPQVGLKELAACIEACYYCAQSCTSCADACLAEDNVKEQRRCIRLNTDCASVCLTTGAMLSRFTETNWGLMRHQLEVCLEACAECAAECEQHAGHMEHCRICAESCRSCESACRDLLAALPA